MTIASTQFLEISSTTPVAPLAPDRIDETSGMPIGTPFPRALVADFARDAVSDDTQLRTYALLDAARLPNLPSWLAMRPVKCRCLYQGRAEAELGQVGPHLVDLDSDLGFTARLMAGHLGAGADKPWHQTGIVLLRTSAGFESLWHHLRRFTRIPDPLGNWVLFRFWEPSTFAAFLAEVGRDLARTQQWLVIEDEVVLQAIYVQRTTDPARRFDVIRPKPDLPWVRGGRPTPLSAGELAAMRVARSMADLSDVVDYLRRTLGRLLTPDQSDALPTTVTAAKARLDRYGIFRKEHLALFVAYEIALGPEFIDQDPDGVLQYLLAAPVEEDRKVAAIKSRMAEMEGIPPDPDDPPLRPPFDPASPVSDTDKDFWHV